MNEFSSYAWRLESTLCPGSAAVHRHAAWFNGGAGSSIPHGPYVPPPRARHLDQYAVFNQQDAERRFMHQIASELCAEPHQSEEAYLRKLQSMLDEVRVHINRHVHSAFYIKTVCGSLADYCFDVDPLRVGASKESSAFSSQIEGAFGGVSCLTYVLEHEKANLAEGFTFVNISTSLVAHGAGFCTQASHAAQLHAWNVTLEEAMEYHASNHAFDNMLTAFEELLCTEPDAEEGDYNKLYNAMAEHMDATIFASSRSHPSDCALSTSDFDSQLFLSANPPTPLDIIKVLDQNTRLTLEGVVHASRVLLELDGCVDDATSARSNETRSTELLAQLVKLSPAHALHNGTWASAAIDFLALPTVYHKLAMMCTKHDYSGFHSETPNASTAPFSSMCELSSDGKLELTGKTANPVDHNPIFDLVASTDIHKCNGPACVNAVMAVYRYQEMLNSVTKMRWDAIRITSGASKRGSSTMLGEQPSWTFQRACPAFDSVVRLAIKVQALLPAVIRDLRAAAPQLSTSCVAPPRAMGPSLDFGINITLAAAVIGEERAARNANKWYASYVQGGLMCKEARG